MIKQEEAEKEASEEQEIMKKIAEEKKKSECIIKAIKERKMENQYNIRAKAAEEQINNIKRATAEQVIIRRNQLKQTIVKMRLDAKRRKSRLAQKLQTVRFEMANEMGKAYKKGDMNRCLNALKSKSDRNTYCTASFPDDYNSLNNCQEGDDFCMLCCDNEFGDFYINERQGCYKKVCGTEDGQSKLNTHIPEAGRWIWQNQVHHE